jgi:hypothetical protein
MRNSYGGTITLSKSGSSDIVIPFATGSAATLKSFTVNAGDTYTITMKISTESKNAYGWVKNQGSSCGPIKTPGNPLTSTSKSTGYCGELIDINAVLKLATASATLTGITANGNNAAVQCWGDAMINDATQDYDFNDFTVVFGYKDDVGVCSAISVYKKVNGAYGTTALTSTELQNLGVGDVLKLVVKSSINSASAIFRITLDGTVGNWSAGSVDSSDKSAYSYEYTVSTPGTYTFEGQVSTSAQ